MEKVNIDEYFEYEGKISEYMTKVEFAGHISVNPVNSSYYSYKNKNVSDLLIGSFLLRAHWSENQ